MIPEIPKWLIVTIAVICGLWILMGTIDFVKKVNTTVGKANNSIQTQKEEFQQLHPNR